MEMDKDQITNNANKQCSSELMQRDDEDEYVSIVYDSTGEETAYVERTDFPLLANVDVERDDFNKDY